MSGLTRNGGRGYLGGFGSPIRLPDGSTTVPTLGDVSSGLAGISFGAAGLVMYFIVNGNYRARVGSTFFEVSQNNTFITTGSIRHEGVISPTQIAANQTDYAPTNGGIVRQWRLSSDASRNIYSLSPSDRTDGTEKELINVGAQNIVLIHDDGATGTAAHRFKFPSAANVTVPADGCATVRYDGTTARWRLVAKNF